MAKRPIIYAIDDDPSILALIQTYLAPLNYDIRTSLTAEKGFEEMQETVPDLILLDVMLPDGNGIDVTKRLRQNEDLRQVPTVMITALTESAQRVRALQAGADDFLFKPIDEAELRARVHSLLKAGALTRERHENRRLRKTLNGLRRHAIVGESICIRAALQKAAHYAKRDFPALITGESGTGKELFAAEIHRLSARKNKPFLTVNCATIPENLMVSELFGYRKGAFTGANRDKPGLLEDAHGGTVFLDEIGEMPANIQVHLLRFLQSNEIKPLGHSRTKKVDVRIIAATNRDLDDAVGDKAFREDLYFRFNVLPLHLPPLRERAGDIELLLDFFLDKESRLQGIPPKKISPEALNYLLAHPWRGNVRELENFVRYMLTILQRDRIEPKDLPGVFFAKSRAAAPPDGRETPVAGGTGTEVRQWLARRSWQEMEKAYLTALLDNTDGNVTRAAKQAGLNRSTFHSRLQRSGLR